MKVEETVIKEWRAESEQNNLTRETINLSSPRLSKWDKYKKFWVESPSYLSIQDISEGKVMELIKNNPETSKILSDYVREIKNFLAINNNLYDIKITLQEDPEDMNFYAFIILIITNYNNIKERFKLEKGIANSLNNLREILLDSREDDIAQILNHISFLVIKNE